MAEYRVVAGSALAESCDKDGNKKNLYTTQDKVYFHIKCTLERSTDVGAFLSWWARYQIYDQAGKLLLNGDFKRTLFYNPSNEDFIRDLGQFSAGTLGPCKVKISAGG